MKLPGWISRFTQRFRRFPFSWQPTPSIFLTEGPSIYGGATINIPPTTRNYKSGGCRQMFTLWAFKRYEPNPDLDGGFVSLGRPFSKYGIKYGTTTSLNEATALRFVANKTSIRVPKVYCAFEYDSVKFILMERIDGIPIQEDWLDRPEAEREDMLQQLKGYYEELRSIPHPRPGAIAAADMQALFDPRLLKGEYGFGPFAKEKDFNNYLRAGLDADAPILSYSGPDSWMTKDEQNDILRMIAMQDNGGHKVCFSHGDPNPGNILVKGNKIVALIDFELAGFYPEYWDYCKAMSVRSSWQFWETEVKWFLQEYPRELEMEQIRRKHFSPDGFRGEIEWE